MKPLAARLDGLRVGKERGTRAGELAVVRRSCQIAIVLT
jgi:hypothetical protein